MDNFQHSPSQDIKIQLYFVLIWHIKS